MSNPAYMTLEFANQGEVSAGAMGEDSVGTLSQANREDQIQIFQFEHAIYSPTDTHSGQRVGTRVHEEMTILKMVDTSSPMLLQALSSGDVITTAEIEWYRINAAGEEEHFFTTTIEDALITRIESYMPDIIAMGSSPTESRSHLEQITFRYHTITWTHEIAGVEGTDSWAGGE